MGTATMDRFEIRVDGQMVTITHPEKLMWPQKGIRKVDYLQYLGTVAPYMLPFLADRALTVIRYPDGVGKKSFYQKNVPAHAPAYVRTAMHDGNEHVVCSNQATLLWLGNQGAVELHVPFNPVQQERPSEIVFDFDPPSREEFLLSVEAVLIVKELLDKLGVISFVKTSGNKGLQIYIPLPDGRYGYVQTRVFTEFFAHYLVAKEPKWFTIERFKAKRGNRLYVDYVQHARGKTIIAPYSLRGNEEALVAAPLYWHEVNRSLSPTHFPLEQICKRLEKGACPFADYQESKQKQKLEPVLAWIESANRT